MRICSMQPGTKLFTDANCFIGRQSGNHARLGMAYGGTDGACNKRTWMFRQMGHSPRLPSSRGHVTINDR